jgi:hypothetical protein
MFAFDCHSRTLDFDTSVAKLCKASINLLIRNGYTARYYDLKHTDPCQLKDAGCLEPQSAGVKQLEEMKIWLRDS